MIAATSLSFTHSLSLTTATPTPTPTPSPTPSPTPTPDPDPNQAQLPAEKLVAAKRALVTLALQGGGAPLCKHEAVRALHPLLDPVSAAKLWRECAQLGLWSAAPPPSPPKPHSVAAASVAAAASAAAGGGGVKGAEVKGGEVKDAPFWAPWARPAARRRVRTPHAAFAHAADEDEEPPPAAAAARK